MTGLEPAGLHGVLRVAQRALAVAAVAVLTEHGLAVELGEYGDLSTIEVTMAGGIRLVLLPMAEVTWGDSEDPDMEVWHVLGRAVDGQWLEPDDDLDPMAPDGCPSVLRTLRAGANPAQALALFRASVADDVLVARFGFHYDLDEPGVGVGVGVVRRCPEFSACADGVVAQDPALRLS